jgi:hypothetical protein
MVLKNNIISRIKENLKIEYESGNVSKHYTFKSFCNNFKKVNEEPIKRDFKCICGHVILYNYKYKHIKRDDILILGTCCIGKYSTLFKECEEAKRKCLYCDVIIRKNKDNLCKKCCKCGSPKKEIYKTCYNCYSVIENITDKTTCKCGKIKKLEYKLCYQCNLKKPL